MDVWLIWLIANAVFLAASLFFYRNNKDETRIAYIERKLERKLDLLLKHFSIEDPGYSANDDIVDLALAGRKIEAIKSYRKLHPNESLKGAKRAVENILRQHRTK